MSVLDFSKCKSVQDYFNEVERVYRIDEPLNDHKRLIVENGLRAALIMIKPLPREK